MALQTWLALLLCLFFLAVSVYSLISYIKFQRVSLTVFRSTGLSTEW